MDDELAKRIVLLSLSKPILTEEFAPTGWPVVHYERGPLHYSGHVHARSDSIGDCCMRRSVTRIV